MNTLPLSIGFLNLDQISFVSVNVDRDGQPMLQVFTTGDSSPFGLRDPVDIKRVWDALAELARSGGHAGGIPNLDALLAKNRAAYQAMRDTKALKAGQSRQAPGWVQEMMDEHADDSEPIEGCPD